jgi:hypothetical protein
MTYGPIYENNKNVIENVSSIFFVFGLKTTTYADANTLKTMKYT